MSRSYSAGVTPEGEIVVECDGQDITPCGLHIAASLSHHGCANVQEAIDNGKILQILAEMTDAGRKQMSQIVIIDPFVD